MNPVRALDAPARRADVYSVEVDGEAVLLDEADQQLHRLNASATLVWSCLDGTTTLEQIAREISEELDLPYDVVLHDTLAVATQLHEQRLVRIGS